MPKGKRIHFMGAGGIGVSALAMLARHGGASVTACDRHANNQTAMLADAGIPVAMGHDPAHVNGGAGIDLLVYTSAVPPEHPERVAAGEKSEKRGKFLARLMDGQGSGRGGSESWGIAGTHGKTTTSWLLTNILTGAGLNPTAFIGGAVPQLGGANYRLGGEGCPFVAELDESDGSFLLPRLDVAVVTNLESEHLSHYGTDDALFAAFREYAAGVGEKGLLVFGADSPACRELYRAHAGRAATFGIHEDADFSAENIRDTEDGTAFELLRRGEPLGEFALNLTGEHNVQNALAAITAALSKGVDADAARAALARTHGVERRMERLGVVNGAVAYSDYAHHPTEVAAAIAAFRRRHRGETLVAFQPHLYSRTRDYADAFGAALGGADRVLLLDIYPAREEPIPGVDSSLLAAEAARRGAKVNGPVPVGEAEDIVLRLAKGCEAVIMMGAGDIDDMARALVVRHGSEKGA